MINPERIIHVSGSTQPYSNSRVIGSANFQDQAGYTNYGSSSVYDVAQGVPQSRMGSVLNRSNVVQQPRRIAQTPQFTPIVTNQQVLTGSNLVVQPYHSRLAVNSQSIQVPVTYNTRLSNASLGSNVYTVGHQRVNPNLRRTRVQKLVPVTQYVPVYEDIDVTDVPVADLRQRVILNEPQAFKSRLVEQQQAHVRSPPPAVVIQQPIKVIDDPMVQTVPAYAQLSRAKSMYIPPPPVPRAQSSCCSPWLIGLLGLLTLAGLLLGIFLGKSGGSSTTAETTAQSVSGITANKTHPSVPPTIIYDGVTNGSVINQKTDSIKPTIITDTNFVTNVNQTTIEPNRPAFQSGTTYNTYVTPVPAASVPFQSFSNSGAAPVALPATFQPIRVQPAKSASTFQTVPVASANVTPVNPQSTIQLPTTAPAAPAAPAVINNAAARISSDPIPVAPSVPTVIVPQTNTPTNKVIPVSSIDSNPVSSAETKKDTLPKTSP